MEASKLLVGLLLSFAVFAPLAMAGPPAAMNASPVVGSGPLTPDIIVGLIGYTPESVRIISYVPEPVERFVAWQEFTGMLAGTALGGQPDAAGCVPICAADTGHGVVGAGPFCDNSSVWVSYGKSLPMGSGYLLSADGGASNLVTCGNGYGPTRTWDILVTVAPMLVAAGPFDGCYATIWDIGADGYCPNSFTAKDTYNTVHITGTGVKATLDFGAAWFDYFLGNGATLARN